jgi:hypothetical protein
MKRIICLPVAVLRLGVSLFAEDMAKATEMTGWLCNNKSVAQTACHAACDQNCADKSGDVVMGDDQGRRTFFRPAWNKKSESLLSLLKLMQLRIGRQT